MSFIYKLLEILFHFNTPSKAKILFSSFHGQYNDNPKYISEKMHDKYPDIEIYWVISDKSQKNDIPDYVRCLKYDTVKYAWIKSKCKVIVENGAGDYLFDNSTKFFDFKKKLKNKKQFDLSTWHGNPIKHIGAQIPGNEFWNPNTFYSTSDTLISGSQTVKEIFEKAFVNLMPVKLLGTPRTDILFDYNECRKKEIKKKLGLPSDKNIVLYAPTYRNNPEDSGVKQLNDIKIDCLLEELKTKFGGDWVFVFRLHNMVLLKIDIDQLYAKYGNQVINGNTYDDMAEYLYCSDVLISDYSGCVFDVALTSTPCFLFAHDRKHYEAVERGLYFSIDSFPYSFSESFDDLLNCIQEYDLLEAENKRKEFLRNIGNIEDGKASERVIGLINEVLNK